tara:strand:+ start:441 stop:587 length:147 start_codon:yes stop_codon:yes gene_type:complete
MFSFMPLLEVDMYGLVVIFSIVVRLLDREQLLHDVGTVPELVPGLFHS